ncbi:YdcF family protein [Thiomicrorhabdus hydrogeniphila]
MNELFFLISKIAWALLSPGNLIIFILFLGSLLLVFNKVRTAKILFIPTGLIAFVLMVYPVSDYLMKPLESRFSKPQTMPKQIDGIIVLGGGEDLKRSLSWNVAELGIGGDRYIGAAHLAKLYPQAPVIFTGGSGLMSLQNTAGEGSIAKQLLTTIGIDPSRLIIESKSRNTYENFLYSKALLPNKNGTYLLVTSAFHMPRAVGIARVQNVNVIAYPVDYRSNSDALRKIDFDFFDHLKALEPAWREWVGLTVYYLTGKTNRVFPSQMHFETIKQMKTEH